MQATLQQIQQLVGELYMEHWALGQQSSEVAMRLEEAKREIAGLKTQLAEGNQEDVNE